MVPMYAIRAVAVRSTPAKFRPVMVTPLSTRPPAGAFAGETNVTSGASNERNAGDVPVRAATVRIALRPSFLAEYLCSLVSQTTVESDTQLEV
jgi:hypothetical protein